MLRRGRLHVLLALVLAVAVLSAQRAPRPNPILILVSFDAWRYDYIDRLPKPITRYDRARRVVQWLSLAEGERPSFITVYFDEVDTAGHDYGVDAPELSAAAEHLDDSLGQMIAGVHALGLDDRTTFVIVSDHGMTPLSMDRVIYFDDYVDPETVDVLELHGFLALAPNDGNVDALYSKLHGKHPALAVYKREQTPARLHYRGNPRI